MVQEHDFWFRTPFWCKACNACKATGLLVWMNAKEAVAFLGYSPSEFNRIAASEEIARHKWGRDSDTTRRS